MCVCRRHAKCKKEHELAAGTSDDEGNNQPVWMAVFPKPSRVNM